MKNKNLLIIISLIVLLGLVGLAITGKSRARWPSNPNSRPTTTASARFLSSTINASGAVTAQDQAKLSFQIAGKLARLSFKEGDKVARGQTVAQLDTYDLQKKLQMATYNLQTVEDSLSQSHDNQKSNLLEAQLRSSVESITKLYGSLNTDETVVLNGMAQRILDENQNNVNSAQAQVDLANSAFSLATLTSPLDGLVTHEDVSVAGVNITPATTFTVADPETMVFRANVSTENIYYISVGSPVSLAIDGLQNRLNGTVVRIYPAKVILGSGQAAYQVDIVSNELKKQAKLDEAGTAIINTNSQNVALVPAWLVLNGQFIWVEDNGTPKLKQVTAGKIHGNEIELTEGLSPADKIITNPKYISALKYPL